VLLLVAAFAEAEETKATDAKADPHAARSSSAPTGPAGDRACIGEDGKPDDGSGCWMFERRRGMMRRSC
jgi:hypothetical protein